MSDQQQPSDGGASGTNTTAGDTATPAPTAQVVAEDTISLIDLLVVLLKRWALIVGTTALAAVGVIAFSVISIRLPPEESPLPNVYTPNALILINDDSSNPLAALSSSGLGDLAALAGVSGGGSGGYGDLIIKLAESRTLLDRVAEELNLAERFDLGEHAKTAAREMISGPMEITMDGATKTIEITYEHTDPEFATELVNAMVGFIEERFASIGANRNLTKLSLQESKLLEVEEEIAELEQRVEDFQREYGTLDIESLAKEQITVLAELRSRLITKEIEIETYRDFATINDPTIARLQAERDNLAVYIREIEQGYSEYEGAMPSQQDLPRIAIEYARLERDLQVQAAIYTSLRQQYEVSKLSTEGDSPIFQILELAEVPEVKSGPSRGMISIIVTVTAFFLSVFLAFVLEYVDRVRHDPVEMAKLQSLRRRKGDGGGAAERA